MDIVEEVDEEEEKTVDPMLHNDMIKSNLNLEDIIQEKQNERLVTRNEESTFKKGKNTPDRKELIRNPQSMSSGSKENKYNITHDSEGISPELFQHMLFTDPVKPLRKQKNTGSIALFDSDSGRKTMETPGIERADSEHINPTKLGSMPAQNMMQDSIM